MDTTQPNYSAFFVFGDSLSDNGAIAALTGGAIPAQTLTGTNLAGTPVDFAAREIFYDGKFTNGDVYAATSARLLEISSDTSTFYDNFSGSNYAVGGATATDLSSFGGTANSTLADQVSTFQTALAGLQGSDADKQAFLASSAASILIGLNDLNAIATAATATGTIDMSVINSGVAEVVQQMAAGSQQLAAAGVGTIVLNTLPGGSFFPSSQPLIDFFGPGTAALFDQVSEAVNANLRAIGSGLEAAGVKVEIVDFFSLAKEIAGDKGTFGFLSLGSLLPNGNAQTVLLIDDIPIDQVGFLDPVHFTAELHEVFGAFQALTLANTQIDDAGAGGSLYGSDDQETIFARGGADRIYASGGDDVIFAGAGKDIVYGGDGDDVAFGGTGNDKVYGGNGGDVLSGGAGKDHVYGGEGNDVLAGNAGDDYLNGGAGNDVLTDGLGDDIVYAGSGDDIVVYKAAGTIGGTNGQDEDVFFGGSGTDTLLIVSDTPIYDVAAFLIENNVKHSGFEEIKVVTSDGLDNYDFGTVGVQADIADMFGLI